MQRYPALRRACFLNPCYDWVIASPWSEVYQLYIYIELYILYNIHIKKSVQKHVV